MGKQDGLSQDHQDTISRDKSTRMENVHDSINDMHDEQGDDIKKNNKNSTAQTMHGSKAMKGMSVRLQQMEILKAKQTT